MPEFREKGIDFKLLQILGTEEVNVEMRYIDLSKYMRLLSSSPKLGPLTLTLSLKF